MHHFFVCDTNVHLSNKEMVQYDGLTLEQLDEVGNHPIGRSAYFSNSGQYRVGGIRIDKVPFERQQEVEE